MRHNHIGGSFDRIREVCRTMGVTDQLPILDTDEEGVFEIRFVIRPATDQRRLTILESIVEELEESGLAIEVSHRTENEIRLPSRESSGYTTAPRKSVGYPPLHFIRFRLPG